VIKGHTGLGWFASIIQLTRRNTRRYGGYIVHYGFIVVCIGLAGAAFNQTNEQELGFKDSMQIGPYTLVCQNYTQDDNPNYESELAILDVYKNGKKIDTLYPEQRFFKANQQPEHRVAIRSNIQEDLYLVYSGRNPDTNRPIIKAHLNPLVGWIWVGVFIMVAGTLVSLVPNLPADRAAPRRVAPASHAEKANGNGAGAEHRESVEVGE
jgi:cytochrome c-type biogenesis protein CcmF